MSESGSEPSRVNRVITKTLERAATIEPAAGGALRRVLDMAIDGVGPLPGAKRSAAKHLAAAAGNVEEAVNALVRTHLALAGAQGFVTNLGGYATLPISLPANLTGVAVVQARMVAAIMHLRGYDVGDNRVRTAIMMSLLGGTQVDHRVAGGTLPTTPMAIATAPVFDPDLDQRVAQEVIKDLAARVSGKQMGLMVIRRIPLVGGGVGAAYDAYTTNQIGSFARTEFRTRRQLPRENLG